MYCIVEKQLHTNAMAPVVNNKIDISKDDRLLSLSGLCENCCIPGADHLL